MRRWGLWLGRLALLGLVAGLVFALKSCYFIAPSSGGGQTAFDPPRRVNPADVQLPPGYRLEAVAQGLTFPVAVAFDGEGRVYVLEAGYSYGEVRTVPRLLEVRPGGEPREVVRGDNPPWNGLSYHEGAFYIAEGGEFEGGRILRLRDGQLTPLVTGLPSVGDHHTNRAVMGPDGYLYFGQGTATNSGVVGPDNYDFGWLQRRPDFHDTPCKDVKLAGRNFESPNPLTPDPGDKAVTGAFLPFGTPSRPGQVVPGRLPCNGAVLRVRPEGGALELVAWGFRNPFGLAFSPDGTLYVSDNSYDERGSRPVFGTGDVLWRVEPGAWYGWPDFHAGRSLLEADHFTSPGESPPGHVLAEHPGTPPKPVALLGVHASANGFDFSRSAAFGFAGQAFVAEFGDMSPGVGKVLAPVGFRVVRVDPATGAVYDFAANKGDSFAPASKQGSGGLERPVDARFSPDGSALYVVDFGVMTVGERPQPQRGTGVLWRVTREGP
ncbi:PQQ-dependent sugar dehydrogenase [Calidithermus chliarophilus]|uniref:PQQ-dependent sugar dehydrogenase n=1 Tax=Calidithermus chliarophilus TaxID=52023 RepID=UPI000686A97A|nr:PQQ-dependent sugar dehydrogenase [Calidithermus chliarophilus]